VPPEPPAALAHLLALLDRLDRRAERLARCSRPFPRVRLVLALTGVAGVLAVGGRYGVGDGWAVAA
jgi:hypothetical protein